MSAYKIRAFHIFRLVWLKPHCAWYSLYYLLLIIQVTVATAQAPPEGVLPPRLSVVNTTTLGATWSPPAEPNGIITKYQLHLQGGGQMQTFTTEALSLVLAGIFLIFSCNTMGFYSGTTTKVTSQQQLTSSYKHYLFSFPRVPFY